MLKNVFLAAVATLILAGAVALGWPIERIHTIDSDLGVSGAHIGRKMYHWSGHRLTKPSRCSAMASVTRCA